jgi:cobalt/nickel transport system permease protein
VIILGRNVRGPVIAGLVMAIGLVTLVSPFSSASPDGLEKVASDRSLGTEVDDHALADGPLADYGVDGLDNERVGTGLAGLIGVGVTFGVGSIVFAMVKRVRRGSEPTRLGAVLRPSREPESAASGP